MTVSTCSSALFRTRLPIRLLFLGLCALSDAFDSQLDSGYDLDNKAKNVHKATPFIPHEHFVVVLANGETYSYHLGGPGWSSSLGHLLQNGVATYVKGEGARVFPGIDGSLYFASGGREIPMKLQDIRVRDIVYDSPITNMPAFPDVVFVGDKVNVLHQVMLGPDYSVHSTSGFDTNKTRIITGETTNSILITFSQTRWCVSALDVSTLQKRFDFEYSDILAFDRTSDESAPRVRISGNMVEVGMDGDQAAHTFGPFDEKIYGVYGVVAFSTDDTRINGGEDFCGEQFTLALLGRGSDVQIQDSTNAPQLLDPNEDLLRVWIEQQFSNNLENNYAESQGFRNHGSDRLQIAHKDRYVQQDSRYSWKDFALILFSVMFVLGGIAFYICFMQQKAEAQKVVSAEQSPVLSNEATTALVPPDSILGKSLHNGRFARDFSDCSMIGQGGFGIVFKANFALEKSSYAIKMIPVELGADDEVNSCRDFQEVFANLTLNDCGKNVVRYNTCWCEEPSFLSVDTTRLGKLCDLVTVQAEPQACKSESIQASKVSSGQSYLTSEPVVDAGLSSRRFCGNNQSFANDNSSMRVLLRTTSNLSDATETMSNWDATEDDGFEWAEPALRRESRSVRHIPSSGATCSTHSRSCILPMARSELLPVHGSKHAFESEPASTSPLMMSEAPSKPTETSEKYRVIVCIQMEYCDGRTLADFLRDISARSKTAAGTKELDMCRQLLKGLKQIHENKVVHRDMKPANVLVSNNSIKIADFGLAVSVNADEKQAVGTPGYTPPEGAGSTAGDMYSTSLILLELLHVPFETAMERVKTLDDFKRTNRVPAAIKQAVPDIAVILKQMGDSNPAKRPTALVVYRAFKKRCHVTEN